MPLRATTSSHRQPQAPAAQKQKPKAREVAAQLLSAFLPRFILIEGQTVEQHLTLILGIVDVALQAPEALREAVSTRNFRRNKNLASLVEHPQVILPPSNEAPALFENAKNLLSPKELRAVVAEIERQAALWLLSKFPNSVEAQTHERRMIESEYGRQLGRALAQKAVIKSGNRYFPLSFAAPLAQAPETTIRDWIKKKTTFDGKSIKTHISGSNGLYISEESTEMMAHRFVKWRSGKPAGPAGPVTIGETDDQSGYIGLTDAARTIAVGHNTLWRWATTEEGKAPTDQPLDVIKCPASDQFYISERNVSDLKKVIPRSGLSRGPRPQLAP